MIKISDYIKDFIEQNIYLIEDNDWNALADKCDDRYLKELVTYLTLAEIPAVFNQIEYSPDTWVATYYSGTSYIISTIEVTQLKDLRLGDGDKINVVLEHTKGPTTIIFKDKKYLNFKRYQVNDTKAINKEMRKAKLISDREKEVKDLEAIVDDLLTTTKLSYTKHYAEWFEIRFDESISLDLRIGFRSKAPSYPAFIDARLKAPNIYEWKHFDFAIVNSVSKLKLEINQFISEINAENNSNIPLI